jgi:hypothetical protein
MNVHLVVSALFPDPERGDAQISDTRAVALEMLFARGRRRSDPGATLEAWLLDAFAIARQSDWPAAPYSLVADAGDPNGAWWLRADPVNLRADRDTVLFADTELSDIEPDEAAALAASLNAHFATTGITIHPRRANRWYARVDRDPAMCAPPAADLRGQPLLAHMPDGPEGRTWRSILNEMQMLLHEHPVNQSREARGAAAVNGLWLWGAGRIAGAPRPVYARVTADHPVARGLALAAGKRAAPLPASAREWLDSAGNSGGAAAGVEVIVLDSLRAPAASRDTAAWRAGLETLERDWFAPLLAALRAGRIGMITLHAPGAARTSVAETTRQDLRHFWRRRRPLATYAAHT